MNELRPDLIESLKLKRDESTRKLEGIATNVKTAADGLTEFLSNLPEGSYLHTRLSKSNHELGFLWYCVTFIKEIGYSTKDPLGAIHAENTAQEKVNKITTRALASAKNNPPSQHQSDHIHILLLVTALSLAVLAGCTTKKAATEQTRDAYWLGQADATKQLYFAKEAAQRPAQESQPNTQYYAIPVEPVPGVKEVPHHVVISVEQ
jgi:hypothetical protein